MKMKTKSIFFSLFIVCLCSVFFAASVQAESDWDGYERIWDNGRIFTYAKLDYDEDTDYTEVYWAAKNNTRWSYSIYFVPIYRTEDGSERSGWFAGDYDAGQKAPLGNWNYPDATIRGRVVNIEITEFRIERYD